jgi:plastocyanin
MFETGVLDVDQMQAPLNISGRSHHSSRSTMPFNNDLDRTTTKFTINKSVFSPSNLNSKPGTTAAYLRNLSNRRNPHNKIVDPGNVKQNSKRSKHNITGTVATLNLRNELYPTNPRIVLNRLKNLPFKSIPQKNLDPLNDSKAFKSFDQREIGTSKSPGPNKL